ncbi:hypothetical protein JCM15908A_17890 [Prevotella dentasini JCM 15908]
MLVQAKEDSLAIGYCMGEVAKASVYGKKDKGDVSAAIHLPAAMVKKYVGNRIASVRVGLASRVNVDSVRVWVRSGLDGANISEGLLKRSEGQKINKGWNEVELSAPVSIGNESGELYIGYTCYQRAEVYAISVVGSPRNGTSFINLNGKWEDIKDAGVLSIEGVFVGDKMPQYDLELNSVILGPKESVSPTTYYAKMNVTNLALRTVSDFKIRIADQNGEIAVVPCKESLASRELKTINIDFDAHRNFDTNEEITFTISELGEGTDEDLSNNSLVADFIFERNVLAEEFTTERCPNCPRVAGYLHSALEEKAEYKNRVFAVCHHSAYHTDWLTQDCDEPLTWLYNDKGTYAPAMMINRLPIFTPSAPEDGATSDNVFLPQSKIELMSYFDQEMERGANCMLSIRSEVNADTSKVNLTIVGQKNASFNTEGRFLTVYIIEDNIDARSQSGAQGKFVHQHVIRAYNSIWGDAIEWNKNTFTKTYSFDINKGNPDAAKVRDRAAWKTKDLQVVAFINNYNPDDKLKSAVENSARVPLLQEVTDAISDVRKDAGSVKEVARYTVDGQKIESPRKGINIVKLSDGTMKKILVK